MRGPGGDLGPLDPSTRVLEFDSLGTRVRNTKRFWVLNPTSVAVEFEWEPTGTAGGSSTQLPDFACATQSGIIGPGKRYEMVFEYTPSVPELQESFWRFRLPQQGLEVLFLAVGSVREPRIAFEKPCLNFGRVQVGGKLQQLVALVNSEHLPFAFQLDKGSYEASEARIASTGKPPNVHFEPASGTVAPNSSLPLLVTFSPGAEGPTNFNVTAILKRKPAPVTLNVKGEGYEIRDSLQLEGGDGRVVRLAAGAPNTIDFGQVLINEKCVKALALVNSGSTNFDFAWVVGDDPRVSVHPQAGTVPPGDRIPCEISFFPHAAHSLDTRVACQIINGHKYMLHLTGVGHKPNLHLSAYSHDFGACFVHQAGMAPLSVVLTARNDDSQEISFDTGYEDTDNLQVSCPPMVLAPGAAASIPITFTPRQPRAFRESIPININGLYTVHVTVTGEACPMRIDLANPALRALSFGAVSRGGQATRTVQVVNRSKVTATMSLAPCLPLLRQHAIEVLPSSDVLLRPHGTADLTFFFRPPTRMRQFKEDMDVMVAGVRLTLLTFSGACLGTEVKLASDSLPFGPVVLGSQATKRLQMENTGDVGTKFQWDAAALGPNFSIHPLEGFLAPNQDMKLDVSFHPTAVSADIRVDKVRCQVDGGEPRHLTLTGACIDTQPEPTPLDFRCSVRGSATQSLPLSNPSSSPWQLKPVIRNDFWSGPEFVTVPAGGKVAYVVTYRPLTMSSGAAPHAGSVFFPIPDGTGVLYNLRGFADNPQPSGTINAAITAKHPHTETLAVSNWLPRPQRFRATIEPKPPLDPATRLSGPQFVDVPGLSDKPFRLGVLAYSEGRTEAVVTFRNEASGEYSFYNVTFTAGPPALQGTLTLECPVRTRATHTITIDNPLPTPVAMTAACANCQVAVPASIQLNPSGPTPITVAYRPLLVGESEAMLRLKTKELGQYEYSLRLKAAPTGPERSMGFSTPLGGSETQVFRFTHWLAEKADYKCSFRGKGGGAFECKPSVSAAPAGPQGSETEVEVTFEPVAVGDSFRDVLVVSSPAGGEYECPVIGRCLPPKPQGPIEMVKGSCSVPFKNIFARPAEFLFAVDNPAFSVKAASETLPAKKATTIAVAFKEDPARPRTGKLTVTCPSETAAPWVFYLQG